MKENDEILGKMLSKLTYVANTGLIYNGNKLAGGICKSGKTLGFGGFRYEYHRVCFALYHERWPLDGMVIDHINRDPLDNRIVNLREVTKSVNGRNTKKYKNGCLIGISGISYDKSCNYYRIRCGKKYLGVTKDFFEACCIRKSFELVAGDFAENHFR